MARSRQRRGNMRRNRPKGDWVYRDDAERSDGGLDDLGTYTDTIHIQGSGAAAAVVRVLYDSKQHIALHMKGTSILPTYVLPSAARTEGSRPLMLRVQGSIYVEPGTWALGNVLAAGLRIGKFEQDAETGDALVDADYSMWDAGGTTSVAQWANARPMNLWERRWHLSFGSDTPDPFINREINVKLRTRLAPHEMLGLYTELEPTSVAARWQMWLRTFVVDEGDG